MNEVIRASQSESHLAPHKPDENVAPPASLDLPQPPKTFNNEVSSELKFEHSVQALTVLSQVSEDFLILRFLKFFMV